MLLGISIFVWTNAVASNVVKQIPQPCAQMKQLLESKLPAKFTFIPPTKKHGLCVLEMHGTGNIFEQNKQDFRTWNKILIKTLHKHHWYNTKRTLIYAANGPFSTTFAYKKNNVLAVVNFEVTGNINNCPKDQPMDLYTNCGLSAAERQYALKITLQK